MSWTKLVRDNRVTALATSKTELDNLRSIVTRSLKDVAASGLSPDARFIMAYDAARRERSRSSWCEHAVIDLKQLGAITTRFSRSNSWILHFRSYRPTSTDAG
jgi:hypothetical protein